MEKDEHVKAAKEGAWRMPVKPQGLLVYPMVNNESSYIYHVKIHHLKVFFNKRKES